MDMRGCAATPRRPSGHLQKQNGYPASQRRREMATEPCCSPRILSSRLIGPSLIGTGRKNSPDRKMTKRFFYETLVTASRKYFSGKTSRNISTRSGSFQPASPAISYLHRHHIREMDMYNYVI